MKEIKREVKTFLVFATCEDCGVPYIPDGEQLLTEPPQFPYKCPNCDKIEVFDKRYPTQAYEFVEESKIIMPS